MGCVGQGKRTVCENLDVMKLYRYMKIHLFFSIEKRNQSEKVIYILSVKKDKSW